MTEPATSPAALLPGYTYFPQTGPGDDAALFADVVAALQELRRRIESSSRGTSERAPAEQPSPLVAAVSPAEAPKPTESTTVGSVSGIRFSWRAGGGHEQWGELRVESVLPHPLRAGTILLTGRWPTGQKAVWEIPADESKWGRGTEIKVRWAAGPGGSPMQAGIFGIVEATTRADGARSLTGIWPDRTQGAIEMPNGWAAAAKRTD